MAAQDAELQLKVSLDLAFFKQQLAGLGSSAAGYRLPINIKFDRLSIQKELNTLGTNIKRRTYRLNVETNLQAEIENASKLAKALDELGKSRKSAQGAINQQLGLGALLPGPQAGGLGSKDVEKLYRAAARAGIVEYNKEIARRKASAVAALEAVGSDSVKGLLNGLNSEDEKLKAAAESLGETLIKTVKGILGIASPSREFKKIGQNVGEGFQQGMLSSMDKAFDAVEGLMRARMKVLDTIARGMFRMAGIDPAAIRAEAAQRRALPGVNFPATIPPRNISIGPSSTGRALPPGAIPSALPGTAFGAQRYLPTALSDELKQILRGAAFAFVDSLKQQIRSVRVGLSATQQPLLGASRIAGLLPAGVGRAPSVYSTGAVGGETRAEMMARREREARVRSALRGMDVMGGGAGRPPSPYSYAYRSARPTSAIVPYGAPGAIVPQPAIAGGAGGGMQPPGGGGGRFGGFGGMIPGGGDFRRAIGSINLPGTGTIRELGSEFAFATKQVLLFGQAYKLLGILQDFPAQVGTAVGQLQSFRNTLGAITPTAEEARASNELILDLMNRYNVPLQSARDGFTKLYASMAPAGFSGDEIRDLFTGITQAAATFGMSADKVDRVNYAFAQMASKGQVMSEELKGQLGDVLPGAMALFAEAAGFEGPKAIQDFSAALEGGVYKGEAMVTLLKNVGIVMKQEFGPGAEGAARTFQGVINRMQNSMTLLYESFEPVAVGFLNTVVTPMTNGIKALSDGFNAFFTGATAQTTGGFTIAQELEKLRPAFDGIRQNAAALTAQFADFARAALEVSKVLLQIIGNPIVGYLARLYTIVLPINIALNVMRGLWAANALQLVIFNTRVATGTSTLTAFRGMMAATGATSQTTAASIRAAGVTLRTFFSATGVGLVLVGISALIEKIMEMNRTMADTRAKALGAAQAIRSMSQTEARQAAQQYEAGAQSLRGLNKQIEEGRLKGKAWVQVTSQQAKALQDAGITVSNVRGSMQVQPTRVAGALQKLEGMAAEAGYRVRQVSFEEQKLQEQAVLAPIPSVSGDGEGAKGGKGKRTPLEQILDMESQRKLKMAQSDKELRLAQLIRDAQLAGNEAEAESLESLSRALDIRGKIAGAQQFIQMLIDKEGEIIGKSLTKEEYNNKLQDANVELYELQNDLQKEFLKLQVSENDQAKKAQDALTKKLEQQQQLNRLLEDAAIAAGVISPQQAAQRLQARKFEDAILRAKELGATPEQLASLSAFQAAIPQAGSIQESIKNLRDELEKLLSTQEMVKFSAASIGEAFASSFKDAITGAATAQEALAGFFQSVGSAFADMAAQMIQKMIQMYILNQVLNILPGMGSFTGGAKVGQSVSMPTGTGIGAGGGILQNSMGQGFGTFGPNFGIRQFANGGMVTGPTLGLIGEGRYNEAVVPLPDGKTIPVDLGGAASNQIVSNITVNVNNGQTQSNANGSNSSELGRKLEGAVKQVIVGELRPGGLLAR